MTDCLSNLSRTEMVHMASSKEWGSALMMARVKEEGESDLMVLICSSTLLMSPSSDSDSDSWTDRRAWYVLQCGAVCC